MKQLTFITGNQHKANYLAQFLGLHIDHLKLDLDEIQSLDLHQVVEHKVRQAYEKIQSPVIVEDVSLEFSALGRLPGTFIKHFIDEIPLQTICSLLENKRRNATARCMIAYYDGTNLEFFEQFLDGEIAQEPSGTGGYGWDSIFIPRGFSTTNAALSEADYQNVYLQIKPLLALKNFLTALP